MALVFSICRSIRLGSSHPLWLPRSNALSMPTRYWRSVVVSSDGLKAVYPVEEEGATHLEIADLHSGNHRALTDPEPLARALAISPSGRWVAYNGQDGLKRVDTGSGAVERLGRGGGGKAWLDETRLAFSANSEGVKLLDTDVGRITQLVEPTEGETYGQLCAFAGGEWVVYSSRLRFDHPSFWLLSSDNGAASQLLERAQSAVCVGERYLIFWRDDTAWLTEVDFERQTLASAAIPLDLRAQLPRGGGGPALDVGGGTLVYRSSGAVGPFRVVAVSPDGQEELPIPADFYKAPLVDPEGEWISLGFWQLPRTVKTCLLPTRKWSAKPLQDRSSRYLLLAF